MQKIHDAVDVLYRKFAPKGWRISYDGQFIWAWLPDLYVIKTTVTKDKSDEDLILQMADADRLANIIWARLLHAERNHDSVMHLVMPDDHNKPLKAYFDGGLRFTAKSMLLTPPEHDRRAPLDSKIVFHDLRLLYGARQAHGVIDWGRWTHVVLHRDQLSDRYRTVMQMCILEYEMHMVDESLQRLLPQKEAV